MNSSAISTRITLETAHPLGTNFETGFLDNGKSVTAKRRVCFGNISTTYFPKPPFSWCVPPPQDMFWVLEKKSAHRNSSQGVRYRSTWLQHTVYFVYTGLQPLCMIPEFRFNSVEIREACFLLLCTHAARAELERALASAAAKEEGSCCVNKKRSKREIRTRVLDERQP